MTDVALAILGIVWLLVSVLAFLWGLCDALDQAGPENAGRAMARGFIDGLLMATLSLIQLLYLLACVLRPLIVATASGMLGRRPRHPAAPPGIGDVVNAPEADLGLPGL
jgi:hypothetical protein